MLACTHGPLKARDVGFNGLVQPLEPPPALAHVDPAEPETAPLRSSEEPPKTPLRALDCPVFLRVQQSSALCSSELKIAGPDSAQRAVTGTGQRGQRWGT
eukprot:418938-Rhodomonas_salina.2